MRHAMLAVAVSLLSSAAFAQLTVGSMPVAAEFYLQSNNGIGPYTVVDLSSPARASGTLTTATVRWNGGCSNAFKLKFLRLTGLSSYTVTAERGPFNAIGSINTVALTPPVAVQSGDVIGVTQLGSLSACGGLLLTFADRPAMAMFFNSDITGIGTMNGTLFQATRLNARASSDPNILEGVIAGAGSLAGSFGSFFRTGLQLSNGTSAPLNGTLVFHPAARSAQPGDPSMTYSLAPLETKSYTDVVQSMGASGLGTLDLISTSGVRPIVAARIFNDNGAAGTSGFTEDFVTPEQALHANEDGFFFTPPDLTNFRMNVGIRTFEQGATLDISLTNAAGVFVTSVTRTYPANYFEQPGLAQFLGVTTPPAGASVYVAVRSGSAVVYASTTDNRTNDSSVRFANTKKE